MAKNDLGEKARQWQETAEAAQQTVQEQAQQVAGKAQEWTERAKGTARDAGAAADLYLHEYAWTTVALVGVFAAAIGYLFGSRRR